MLHLGRVSSDLGSLNIQRGRDHGIPNYNAVRQFVGLTPIRSMQERPQEIADEVWKDISAVYEKPDDIDLYVGGLSESASQGGILGPAFTHLISEQFRFLKEGDRFFFTHSNGPNVRGLKSNVQDMIMARRFSDIICENTEIQSMQGNVFLTASPSNPSIPCQDPNRPKLDFNAIADSFINYGGPQPTGQAPQPAPEAPQPAPEAPTTMKLGPSRNFENSVPEMPLTGAPLEDGDQQREPLQSPAGNVQLMTEMPSNPIPEEPVSQPRTGQELPQSNPYATQQPDGLQYPPPPELKQEHSPYEFVGYPGQQEQPVQDQSSIPEQPDQQPQFQEQKSPTGGGPSQIQPVSELKTPQDQPSSPMPGLETPSKPLFGGLSEQIPTQQVQPDRLPQVPLNQPPEDQAPLATMNQPPREQIGQAERNQEQAKPEQQTDFSFVGLEQSKPPM